jgi:hypothetical protein
MYAPLKVCPKCQRPKPQQKQLHSKKLTTTVGEEIPEPGALKLLALAEVQLCHPNKTDPANKKEKKRRN